MEKRARRMVVVVMLVAVGCASEPTYTRRSYYAPGAPYQTNSANANAVPSDRPIAIESPTFHDTPSKRSGGFWRWLFGEPEPKDQAHPMPFASWSRPATEPKDK